MCIVVEVIPTARDHEGADRGEVVALADIVLASVYSLLEVRLKLLSSTLLQVELLADGVLLNSFTRWSRGVCAVRKRLWAE